MPTRTMPLWRIRRSLTVLRRYRNNAIVNGTTTSLPKCERVAWKLVERLLRAGFESGAYRLWDDALAEVVLARDQVRSRDRSNEETLRILSGYWRRDVIEYCEVECLQQIIDRPAPMNYPIVEAQLGHYRNQLIAIEERNRFESIGADDRSDASPEIENDIW